MQPTFSPQPRARADLTAGALYAVRGEGDWIYYGQVTASKDFGFFHRRDLEVADPSLVFGTPMMSVIAIAYPSITRALRSGLWIRMGRFAVAAALREARPTVQWPVGTLAVTVWRGDEPEYETSIDDPAIQHLELMAAWDAEQHMPTRLTADFGAEPPEWHVGGPIARERRIKEEMAARFPDALWHQLPADWVSTDIR